MKKQVAVLGAGGFFGSRFVEQSYSLDDLDIRPVLRAYRGMAALCKFGLSPHLQLVDTTKVEALTCAFEGCSVVVNLTMGDSTRILADTEIIYAATKRAHIDLLIHMSSAVLYGGVRSNDIDDDAPPQGSEWNLYAREKARAEEYLRSTLAQVGPRVVVLRPFLIWGPRSVWTTKPAQQLLQGQAWLANNGAGICNLCHADNLVRYIHQVIHSSSETSGFYNVADPDTVTWRQYYEGIAQGLGLPLNRVRTLPPGPFRISGAAVTEWIKQQHLPYKASRWLLDNLSGESKSLLKYRLPALAGGPPKPPLSNHDPLPSGVPGFSRDQWTAQHTVRKLPSTKFYRDFGDPGLITFEVALNSTVAWLRFAGFADF